MAAIVSDATCCATYACAAGCRAIVRMGCSLQQATSTLPLACKYSHVRACEYSVASSYGWLESVTRTDDGCDARLLECYAICGDESEGASLQCFARPGLSPAPLALLETSTPRIAA